MQKYFLLLLLCAPWSEAAEAKRPRICTEADEQAGPADQCTEDSLALKLSPPLRFVRAYALLQQYYETKNPEPLSLIQEHLSVIRDEHSQPSLVLLQQEVLRKREGIHCPDPDFFKSIPQILIIKAFERFPSLKGRVDLLVSHYPYNAPAASSVNFIGTNKELYITFFASLCKSLSPAQLSRVVYHEFSHIHDYITLPNSFILRQPRSFIENLAERRAMLAMNCATCLESSAIKNHTDVVEQGYCTMEELLEIVELMKARSIYCTEHAPITEQKIHAMTILRHKGKDLAPYYNARTKTYSTVNWHDAIYYPRQAMAKEMFLYYQELYRRQKDGILTFIFK